MNAEQHAQFKIDIYKILTQSGKSSFIYVVIAENTVTGIKYVVAECAVTNALARVNVAIADELVKVL